MSTKTLRKRIALVAVAALGAGVLSVAPANAVASGIAGGTNLVATTSILSVATMASTTGSAVSNDATDGSTNRSTGLLYKDTSTGTAQSATVLSTGALAVFTLGDTDVAFVASGGAFAGLSSSSAATNSISADRKTVASLITTPQVALPTGVTWSSSTPGTYQISLYRGAAIAGTSTAGDGTLVGLLNVTVVAASAGGSYSAADSACVLQTSHAAVTSSSVDAAGADYRVNGASGFITFDLKDAYGVDLPAGATVATATNGAYVNIVAGSTKGIGSTAVTATAPQDLSVVVSQPTANAPLSTTVTITYNGTVICTKSLKITGEVASMKAFNVLTGTTAGGANAKAFQLRTYDSAGNLILPLDGTARFAAVSASLSTIVTAASISGAAVALTGDTAESYSTGTFTCGGTAGTTPIKIAYQNPSGTAAVSPAISARCAGAADTYTASFDKASYVQGEIATLKVQFKDTLGNNANSYASTGNTGVVTAPMMTQVGSLADAATPDVNGAISIKFTVGGNTAVTAGSYNALVDYSTLTAANATIQTVSYKVGDSGVTNADVLKAIVSLIASINKQIAALQKALLKR